MHHSFIDAYADLNTLIHKFDAKIKLISFTFFLLMIIFTPIRYATLFLLYFLIIASLIYISKVPISFIFKRLAEMLPFIIIISLYTLFRKRGGIIFLNCTIKATLAMVSVLIISSTTRFNQLLEALRELKMPRLFVDLLSFMYRYTFLLEDQLLMSRRAYASRNISPKNNFMNAKILGNILGAIFIKTYERAERIYLAMCARGYDGKQGN